ncbi:hypothetical protein P4O66_013819 [Electrophorus voltai]|uniref:Uncharacterized protein n=1 Tax=Electrophorus voltai TaxID=2609070 RepID=A0AAD8Z3L9_9TELE|nr:hypothetical protein P4O66_013819 [Electrophorus voltai]
MQHDSIWMTADMLGTIAHYTPLITSNASVWLGSRDIQLLVMPTPQSKPTNTRNKTKLPHVDQQEILLQMFPEYTNPGQAAIVAANLKNPVFAHDGLAGEKGQFSMWSAQLRVRLEREKKQARAGISRTRSVINIPNLNRLRGANGRTQLAGDKEGVMSEQQVPRARMKQQRAPTDQALLHSTLARTIHAEPCKHQPNPQLHPLPQLQHKGKPAS